MNNNELSFIRDMFNSIAPKYDLLNRLLSLRRDVYWRANMVSNMRISSNANILDVACGTGDVSIEIVRQKGTLLSIIAVDFSENMLALARDKINKKLYYNIDLVAADVLSLPFPIENFDAITMAFGIRNVQNRINVLKTFYSLLKTGGSLSILELSAPNQGDGFMSRVFMYYFKHVLPKVGWLFSKDSFAYHYLPESVIKFHESNEFVSMMSDAGFSHVSCKSLSMGIANLFVGYKR